MTDQVLTGLFDELVKIAEDSALENREKIKKWLKNTALIAGGAGLGAAVTTAADRILGQKLGPSWRSLNPNTRRFIVGPLLGIATMGSMLAAKEMMEERRKMDQL